MIEMDRALNADISVVFFFAYLLLAFVMFALVCPAKMKESRAEGLAAWSLGVLAGLAGIARFFDATGASGTASTFYVIFHPILIAYLATRQWPYLDSWMCAHSTIWLGLRSRFRQFFQSDKKEPGT